MVYKKERLNIKMKKLKRRQDAPQFCFTVGGRWFAMLLILAAWCWVHSGRRCSDSADTPSVRVQEDKYALMDECTYADRTESCLEATGARPTDPSPLRSLWWRLARLRIGSFCQVWWGWLFGIFVKWTLWIVVDIGIDGWISVVVDVACVWIVVMCMGQRIPSRF